MFGALKNLCLNPLVKENKVIGESAYTHNDVLVVFGIFHRRYQSFGVNDIHLKLTSALHEISLKQLLYLFRAFLCLKVGGIKTQV